MYPVVAEEVNMAVAGSRQCASASCLSSALGSLKT